MPTDHVAQHQPAFALGASHAGTPADPPARQRGPTNRPAPHAPYVCSSSVNHRRDSFGASQASMASNNPIGSEDDNNSRR